MQHEFLDLPNLDENAFQRPDLAALQRPTLTYAPRILLLYGIVSKLGRGGSARLLPLVMSDSFAEIGPEVGDVERGANVRFHPFCAAFAL